MEIRYANADGNAMDLTGGKVRVVSVNGISPYSAIALEESPFFDGSLYVSERTGTRNITLLVAVCGDYTLCRRDLQRIFRTKEEGVLYITFDDGIERKIGCRVEKITANLKERNDTVQISLLCPTPFFEEVTERNSQLCGEEDLWEFPNGEDSGWELVNDMELSRLNVTNSAAIYNDGDIETGCIITVIAAQDAYGVKITNADTGKWISVNCTLGAGQQLVFDTRNGSKKITLGSAYADRNDGEDITHLIVWGSDFIQLQSGKNRLYVTAKSGIGGLSVSVAHTALYEGV